MISMDAPGTLEHMRAHAEIARAAYTGVPPPGFAADPELSNEHRTTYVSGGQAYIAIPGTRSADRDLTTDLLLAAGLHHLSARFRNAAATAQRAAAKYGPQNVSVVGHSLGGSQALYVAAKHGLRAVAYNPYVSPSMALHGAIDKVWQSWMPQRGLGRHATIYATRFDPISGLRGLAAARAFTVRAAGRQSAHSIRNFL
jgi:pimeloyl-ACP methyl ester carboxylesterase